MRMKQKNSKWPIFQNGRFSKSPILKKFSRKFQKLVLGLVELIDTKAVNVAKPILWQYGLWRFQTGGTKLERFLPKNQHTQRKLLNFENWISMGLRSFQKSEF